MGCPPAGGLCMDAVALSGGGMLCDAGRGEFDGGPDDGRGIGGLEKSSNGGM